MSDSFKQEHRRLLEEIAQAWNTKNISYVITHGLEHYPIEIGRDLDILADKSQQTALIEIARKIFAENGYDCVQPPPLWGKRLVAFRSNQWNSGIEIHTFTSLTWNNVVLARIPATTFQIGPFKSSFWPNFVKRALLPLLANDRKRWTERAAEFELSAEEIKIFREKLPSLCGKKMRGDLLAAFESRDLPGIVALLPELRRTLRKRALIIHPFASFREIGRKAHRAATQWYSPSAPVIALAGFNHADKIAIFKALEANPSIFTKIIARELTNKGREQKSFRLVLRRLKTALADRRETARQRLVVHLTPFIDGGSEPQQHGFSEGVADLVGNIIPQPDLTIWVKPAVSDRQQDFDGEVVQAVNNEAVLSQIQNGILRTLIKLLDQNQTFVPASLLIEILSDSSNREKPRRTRVDRT